jgi:hypothetical protein
MKFIYKYLQRYWADSRRFKIIESEDDGESPVHQSRSLDGMKWRDGMEDKNKRRAAAAAIDFIHFRRQNTHRSRAISTQAANRTPMATNSTKAQVCSFRQHSANARKHMKEEFWARPALAVVQLATAAVEVEGRGAGTASANHGHGTPELAALQLMRELSVLL